MGGAEYQSNRYIRPKYFRNVDDAEVLKSISEMHISSVAMSHRERSDGSDDDVSQSNNSEVSNVPSLLQRVGAGNEMLALKLRNHLNTVRINSNNMGIVNLK